MLVDKILEMFHDHDVAIRDVVAETLAVEQEHISESKPHISQAIDDLVDLAARDQIRRDEHVMQESSDEA